MRAVDVIHGLLQGAAVDRMGLFDSPWADTLQKWVGQGYPVDESGQPQKPGDHFQFDMINVGGWFDCLPLAGFSEIVEETESWAARRNGAGAVLKYWKHKSGTPEHIDFSMTSRSVWEEKYRPHLLKVDRQRLDIDGTRERLAERRGQDLWTFYGHLFIWENMRQSLGDVGMYENLLLDPGWIHDYNRVYTDFFKSHYRVLFEEAGLPDGIWVYEDLGYKNGLFCSPQILAELIMPYYHELVEFFHGYGLPVVLHSCGGIEQALPLIVEAGFDGLNPMEVKAGCDVLRFAAMHGSQLAFVGGLDARVLESGDRQSIRHEVLRLVHGMKDLEARWVFGSDHSISTNVDYDSFCLALDVFRENMSY